VVCIFPFLFNLLACLSKISCKLFGGVI
jgi:hypothetical protein